MRMTKARAFLYILTSVVITLTAHEVYAEEPEPEKPMPIIIMHDRPVKPKIEVEVTEYVPEPVEEDPVIPDIEETYISAEAYAACEKYGAAYGIPPELLMAMIETESEGKANAYNHSSASGLMQVSVKWHEDRMIRLGITNVFDTDQNIHLASDYIAELKDQCGDMELVLMTYNMGYNKAVKFYQQGKVSRYAKDIINRAEELEKLHEALYNKGVVE